MTSVIQKYVAFCGDRHYIYSMETKETAMTKLMKVRKVNCWGYMSYEVYDESRKEWVRMSRLGIDKIEAVTIGGKIYTPIAVPHKEKVTESNHVSGWTETRTVHSTLYKINTEDGRLVDMLWFARRIAKAPVMMSVSG